MNYVIYIGKSGEINSVEFIGGGQTVEEGWMNSEIYAKYVDSINGDSTTFINRHYYNFDTGSFMERSLKPHPAAYWNSDINDWSASLANYLFFTRDERNLRLVKCDWTQGGDSPLTSEEKAAWATYRTTLRQITDDIQTNPENYLNFTKTVEWPLDPTVEVPEPEVENP
jgi:hypothetical protein